MAKYSTIGLRGEKPLFKALEAERAGECAKWLSDLSSLFEPFDVVMPRALRGEWTSVVDFVRRWDGLIGDLLDTAYQVAPDLVRPVNNDFGILTASHRVSAEPVHHLFRLAEEAPFSPFVSCYGPAVGIGVTAVDELRMVLPGFARLQLDEACGWPDLPEGSNPDRFRRLVAMALRKSAPPIARAKELFGLSSAEVADLFGVSRQAVMQWEASGEIPAARRSKLNNLLAVGEIFERKLRPERLPLVARKPASDYGGLTMLEMVRHDRDAELLEITELAFDWSTTA